MRRLYQDHKIPCIDQTDAFHGATKDRLLSLPAFSSYDDCTHRIGDVDVPTLSIPAALVGTFLFGWPPMGGSIAR
jgi:hypothetical protein